MILVVILVLVVGVVVGLLVGGRGDESLRDGSQTAGSPADTVGNTTTTSNTTSIDSSDNIDDTLSLDSILATVPSKICVDRIPGQGWGDCPANASLTHGGGACQVVVHGLLHQIPEADVVLHNSGACRYNLEAGNFTYEDAQRLSPFTNQLIVLEMMGSEIELVLEQAMDHILVNNSTGAYPYAAGLRFEVDLREAFGDRVSFVEVNEGLMQEEWHPLEMDQLYRLVTNSYLVTNGDSYFALGEVPEDFVVNTQMDLTETFVQYAVEQGVLVEPPLSEWSTQMFHGGLEVLQQIV